MQRCWNWIGKKGKSKKGNPFLFRCAPWKNLYMIPKRKDVFMWVRKKQNNKNNRGAGRTKLNK